MSGETKINDQATVEAVDLNTQVRQLPGDTLLFRLQQLTEIAIYKQSNGWWMTDFTKEQFECSILECIKLVEQVRQTA